MVRVAVLVVVSGCASLVGPLLASESGPSKGNAEASKFSRCGTGGYLVGAAIDSVAVAGDLLVGSEINAVDALVLAPFVIDVLIGTVRAVECLRD